MLLRQCTQEGKEGHGSSLPLLFTSCVLVTLLYALIQSSGGEGWREMRPIHDEQQAPLTKAPAFNSSLALYSANRCLFYPRCLLFSCCSPEALIHTPNSSSAFACMEAGHCTSMDRTLDERLEGHELVDVVITRDILDHGLATLLPTPPTALSDLKRRREFRVLYLAQGDGHKYAHDPLYETLQQDGRDLLYLTFREGVEADLFFPHSNLCEGRMALYLAARLLEVNQGWLYDFMVFMDDDVMAKVPPSHIAFFEMDLLQWEPAIGGPLYGSHVSPTPISAVGHLDFILIAYHREALETLHPWVFDYDHTCTWASQLTQLYEANLAYRNHILWSKSFSVDNGQHREYPRDCMTRGGTVGFSGVWASTLKSVDPSRHHCLPSTDQVVASFPQYILLGAPRPKLSTYAIPESVSALDFVYATSSSGSGMDSGIPAASGTCPSGEGMECCSVEEFWGGEGALGAGGGRPRSTYHGKVVSVLPRITTEWGDSVYHFVWEGMQWEFEGEDILASLGFHPSTVLNVTKGELGELEPLPMRSNHARYSSFPRGAHLGIEGSRVVLVAGEGGVLSLAASSASTSSSSQPPFLSIPPWRLRYLALTSAARDALGGEQGLSSVV